MKISDIGFLKTEPTSKFKNRKLGFRGLAFKKPTSVVWGWFFTCLIHSSSCSIIGSTVNEFFFMPCLCTSSSESLRLTINWTNSARKYISSVMHIKQHTGQKTEPKTETAVNLVKPKPNRKPQFFFKTEPKTELKSLFANHTPLDTAAHYVAILCPRKRTTGPAVQHADIPPPQSATLGLRPVARKLLLISRPAKGRRLSRSEHTVGDT